MSDYLVDTNIPSELTRPTPEPAVHAFLRETKEHVFVSVLSIGEIRKGISSLPASTRRVALQDWLKNHTLVWRTHTTDHYFYR